MIFKVNGSYSLEWVGLEIFSRKEPSTTQYLCVLGISSMNISSYASLNQSRTIRLKTDPKSFEHSELWRSVPSRTY